MARAILARPVALLARKNGLSHFGTLIVTGFGTIARAFLARPVKCQRARTIREINDSCITLSARMAHHSGTGMQYLYGYIICV